MFQVIIYIRVYGLRNLCHPTQTVDTWNLIKSDRLKNCYEQKVMSNLYRSPFNIVT